ncbi:uncharacterized protein LOC123685936 [Harmonia axyridis]|uniref:uncharacterized protein LOC123685936 n=1 Tax=Harmonia axyridis TaxID=115357 RepID=UPI001E279BE0|nr:uncharacterized protein LOC123685936 [Harmonia axyridis]
MGKPTVSVKEVSERVDRLSEEFKKGFEDFKVQFIKSQSTFIPTDGPNILELFEKFETKMNDVISEIKSDLNRIKDDMVRTKNKLKALEIKGNSNILLVHGIPETKSNIIVDVCEIFKNQIGIDIYKNDINSCQRMGRKKVNSDKKKPRPVAVDFCRRWTRDAVFVNKRKLKGSKILITELLSIENLLLLKETKKFFGKSVWTHNGLIYCDIDGKRVHIGDRGV